MPSISFGRGRLSAMSESKRNTILAILLIGLILVFTPSYLRFINPPVEDKLPDPMQVDTPPSNVPGRITTLSPVTFGESGTIDNAIIGATTSAVVQEVEESFISIETPLYSAQLSSMGGGKITKWVLYNYLDHDSNPVKMLHTLDSGNLGIRFTDINRDTIDLSSFNWLSAQENQTFITLNNEESTEISFYTQLNNGSIIRKTFRFSAEKYDFTLTLDVPALAGATIDNRYSIYWETPLLSTERYLNDDMQYARGLALLGGELEEIDASDGKIEREYFDGSVSWAATRTKYFTAVIIPERSSSNRVMLKSSGKTTIDGELYKSYEVSLDVPVVNSSGSSIHTFTVYLGPISADILQSYQVDLQKMMNFGWGFIRPIGRAVLWSFVKLHAIIPNYGFVIIIFSILIKILVYPLTHKSYVSMKKMQDLQPVIAELKEKYKNDQPTMQKKQMQLFKEKGVNPLGGCLPMLIQMPLLFALFTVFRSTIELRGAEFIWWITDLSSQDTLFTLPFSLPIYGPNVNFLPIFMGFTMYLLQKYSGQSSTSEQQKLMGYFMPVFMVLFFNTFPSGLNLYYSLFNIFSVIQTKYLSDGIISKIRGRSTTE